MRRVSCFISSTKGKILEPNLGDIGGEEGEIETLARSVVCKAADLWPKNLIGWEIGVMDYNLFWSFDVAR